MLTPHPPADTHTQIVAQQVRDEQKATHIETSSVYV